MYKGEIFLNEIWNAYLAHIENCEQILYKINEIFDVSYMENSAQIFL